MNTAGTIAALSSFIGSTVAAVASAPPWVVLLLIGTALFIVIAMAGPAWITALTAWHEAKARRIDDAQQQAEKRRRELPSSTERQPDVGQVGQSASRRRRRRRRRGRGGTGKADV